ncbi:DUF5076 domain-containing protein [Parasphingorhabdus sp.]|jgi:Domain of unknown function (DUF5076)|uniref:DUF5076 domain-containing protein n=1 Tax=Parasphingorhabdus sp. TaxID=2709688 RepID=UPI003BAFB265
MFGKKKQGGRFDNAIAVDQFDFLDQSHEVARLWVEDGAGATCIIQPEHLEMPEMFGMLMVDSIRHGSRAFAQAQGISEAEALSRIWAGLDAERNRNTTDLDTVQNYQKPD